MKVINARYEILSEIYGTNILKNIERAARTCYKSEDKITEESAKNMIKTLIKNGHEAMLEHESISVKFICDRGVSHEIVRHRMASYAQESTRYCNYSKDKFDKEITYINLLNGINLDTKMKNLSLDQKNLIIDEWLAANIDAEKHYLKLIELGATPQIARSVLSNGTKTEIVVTMNIREWRHLFKLRTPVAAHPQMRELTIPLLKDFKTLIPIVFDDILVEDK